MFFRNARQWRCFLRLPSCPPCVLEPVFKTADPARIACYGGSAGGLLMGAVLNLAPEKYAVSIAQVPFVDALTTILDPDLPLSALEWEEWGNPIEDKEVYE